MGCSESEAWQASSGRMWRWLTLRLQEPPSSRDLTTMSGVLSVGEEGGGREKEGRKKQLEGEKGGREGEGGRGVKWLKVWSWCFVQFDPIIHTNYSLPGTGHCNN